MWNELFFIYSVALMVFSGMVETRLKDAGASINGIKYLNSVLLSLAIAMSSLITGIVLGQSAYLCAGKQKVKNIYAAISLAVMSLVIEGIIISIVSHKEFKELDTAFGNSEDGKNKARDIKATYYSLLTANSITSVLVLVVLFYPVKKSAEKVFRLR